MNASIFFFSLYISQLVFIMPLSVRAQDLCKCHDKKAADRYRSNQKHDLNFDAHPKASRTIAPQDIIDWQKKYKFMVTEVTRGTPDHKRVLNTPEDTLYELKGFMWFLKHENDKKDGDCDLHIEIGPEQKSKKRVIVELTSDDCNAQQIVVDHIKAKGYKYRKDFTAGIPVTIIGLGFYDGFHSKSGHGRKGVTTSSAWELHPIKRIDFSD